MDRIFSDDSVTEMIEALVDNEYCPYGKQEAGCPLGSDGEPMFCEECWGEWVADFESCG